MNHVTRSVLLPFAVLLAASSALCAAEPIGLLVTPEELVSRRDDAPTVILDVRSDRDYAGGHIPHAVWVDLNAWKDQSLASGGLADERAWSDRVGKLGITRAANLVVYGGNPTDASRLWWILKYLGVEHVGILDGGFEAWVDAGAPVSREPAQPKADRFQPVFQKDRLADLDEVQSVIKLKSATVIDTRSDAEFSGTGGPGPRRGHIPGAVHQEWTNFLTDDGHFKPVDEIKRLLQEQGLTPDTKAVTHCQTGGRASLNAFAMELAGYGPVKNYYCGWSEWSATENAPVE